jgi:RNA polymerase sigma factor (sigma-70 family)
MSDFEQIVEDYNDLIWKIVHKYSSKLNDKEDFYQECLTKLYEEYTKYDDKYKFSTFMYPILDNHLVNLVKSENTYKRKNHITVNGVDITLKDIKNFNFDLLYDEPTYTDKELRTLEVCHTVLQRFKRKDLIESILVNKNQSETAREYGISRQRVSQIWKDYIKEVKNEMS